MKPVFLLASTAGLALGLALNTSAALACACGCSMFDVGGIGNLPQEDDHGGRVFFEWYHGVQNKNWTHAMNGGPDLNSDKRISTDWIAVGGQYMFNREWGVMAKAPYADRAFTTDPGDGVTRFNSTAWGDVEIQAMYTGFSKDLSTGLTFGIKLPTGEYKAAGFDRDTQIGSGSTDLLIGFFHRGLVTGDNAWQYFAQARLQLPIAASDTRDPDTGIALTYRPGAEIDGATGIVYNGGYGWLGLDKVAPVLQLIASHRERDHGNAADPANTGYERLFIAPGVELTKVIDEQNRRVFKVYGDIEIPLYTRTNADGSSKGQGQLVAPALLKLSASYNF